MDRVTPIRAGYEWSASCRTTDTVTGDPIPLSGGVLTIREGSQLDDAVVAGNRSDRRTLMTAFTALIGGGRPIRFCPSCQQADDHPRHVIDDGGHPAVAKHMDCCRADGCPDGTCVVVTAGAADLRGADLLAHIEGLDHSHVAAEIAAYRAEHPEQLERFRLDGDPTILRGADR